MLKETKLGRSSAWIWNSPASFKQFLTPSDPRPDKLFWHSFWHIIWKHIRDTHILTFFLAYIPDILLYLAFFKHSIWHPFWHILTLSEKIGHSFWNVIGPCMPKLIWSSPRGSGCACPGWAVNLCVILSYLASSLASILPVYLTFYLASILTLFLAFYLAYIQHSVWIFFWQVRILTFFLACVRARVCLPRSGARACHVSGLWACGQTDVKLAMNFWSEIIPLELALAVRSGPVNAHSADELAKEEEEEEEEEGGIRRKEESHLL